LKEFLASAQEIAGALLWDVDQQWGFLNSAHGTYLAIQGSRHLK